MIDNEKEPPLFDDVREALVFALNANDQVMPRPLMNKAMAAAPGKKFSKTIKKKYDLQVEETRRVQLYPRAHFKGLDKAHQAGLIIAKLETLGIEQSTVLKGLLIHPHDLCSCGQPCCCGSRPNARWCIAVKQTCHILKEMASVMTKLGKRGLSTQPVLRQKLVETWYTGSRLNMKILAKTCGVSVITANVHNDLICAWLQQTETEAWSQIAPILDQAGIVGTIK